MLPEACRDPLREIFSILFHYIGPNHVLMKFPGRASADIWITKILSYPGIDEKTLTQKKINWIASVAVTSMILCLTIAYHIIFPQLRILIYYGLFLTLVFTQGILYPLIFRRTGIWILIVDQVLVAVATFIAMLKLGGIPYSGGLVMVGIALVFFSLNFRKRSHSIWIYVLYVITVIFAGLLHPYLTVPPEMTPEVNISLFVINILWISGFAMVFVLSFISQSVKLEQIETSRVKELDEAKTRLYTNITHEFRTPITIISGMTDLIRNEPERWLNKGTEKIDQSVNTLKNLVDQMLDLAKLEAGAMPVNMIRADVNLYIRYVVELFRSVADDRNIKLRFIPNEAPLIIDHDPDKLIQIMSNLISNSIKFTKENDTVEIITSLTENGNYQIRVSDNGPGIPEEKLPFIFDRFYRADEKADGTIPGSGLGLALVKEIVKLLGGKIAVKSGSVKGTEFIISLPVTYNAPLQEKQQSNGLEVNVSTDKTNFNDDARDSGISYASDSGHEKPLLLITEDNDDVVTYLRAILEEDYVVMTADDGREGVRIAVEYVPDIILSDIMMPLMDGIEMLSIIKDDMRTSHIPVVMLTAKADIDSRIEGIEKGADAYIAKPFKKEELLVQLRSLTESRKRLRQRYVATISSDMSEEKDFSVEDAFINRVREVMTANLGNEMYDINSLCSEVAMSRTQLYRKFRSLTGTTPNQYFLAMRLHEARKILSLPDVTVAEAAYKTGFKNISHFSQAFSREFGTPPREVRK